MATSKDKLVKTYEAVDNALQDQGFISTLSLDTDGNPIVDIKDHAHMNAWLTAIIDKVGLTRVRHLGRFSGLRVLKQGVKRMGLDVEEIHVNPAKAYDFDPNANPFPRMEPDVAAVYHRLNREEQYGVTVERDRVRRAFTNIEVLDGLLEYIVETLYEGNDIDEFKYTKQLLTHPLTNSTIRTRTLTAPVTDEDSAKKFVKMVRNLATQFEFPSTEYNNYPLITGDPAKLRTTRARKENQVIVMRADLEAEVDVEVLAWAFNTSYAQLAEQGRILYVDNFGPGNEKVAAYVIDREYAQIWDDTYELSDQWNGKSRYWNYFWTVFQTYSLSPFSNAVAILEP